MTVYVDDSRKAVGPYVMARMFGDTDKELQALAGAIGLAADWSYDAAGGSGAFYQVSPGLRLQATRRRRGIEAAQEVTAHQAAAMLARRRATGELGAPAAAIEWLRAWREQQPQETAGGQP